MFSISIVKPDILSMTSPGFVAFPAGIFSTAGTRPITFTGSFVSISAEITPKTEAPPHISNFISSIPRPGLRLMPPVSKVTAFPTSIIGFRSSDAPLYFSVIKLLFCSDALPTDKSDIIFNFSS